jgi:hypothetical protein
MRYPAECRIITKKAVTDKKAVAFRPVFALLLRSGLYPGGGQNHIGRGGDEIKAGSKAEPLMVARLIAHYSKDRKSSHVQQSILLNRNMNNGESQPQVQGLCVLLFSK